MLGVKRVERVLPTGTALTVVGEVRFPTYQVKASCQYSKRLLVILHLASEGDEKYN